MTLNKKDKYKQLFENVEPDTDLINITKKKMYNAVSGKTKPKIAIYYRCLSMVACMTIIIFASIFLSNNETPQKTHLISSTDKATFVTSVETLINESISKTEVSEKNFVTTITTSNEELNASNFSSLKINTDITEVNKISEKTINNITTNKETTNPFNVVETTIKTSSNVVSDKTSGTLKTTTLDKNKNTTKIETTPTSIKTPQPSYVSSSKVETTIPEDTDIMGAPDASTNRNENKNKNLININYNGYCLSLNAAKYNITPPFASDENIPDKSTSIIDDYFGKKVVSDIIVNNFSLQDKIQNISSDLKYDYGVFFKYYKDGINLSLNVSKNIENINYYKVDARDNEAVSYIDEIELCLYFEIQNTDISTEKNNFYSIFKTNDIYYGVYASNIYLNEYLDIIFSLLK